MEKILAQYKQLYFCWSFCSDGNCNKETYPACLDGRSDELSIIWALIDGWLFAPLNELTSKFAVPGNKNYEVRKLSIIYIFFKIKLPF